MVPYLFALHRLFEARQPDLHGTSWDLPAHLLWSNYANTLFQQDFIRFLLQHRPGDGLPDRGPGVLQHAGRLRFARLRFPGRDTIFWVYLLTLMVPKHRDHHPPVHHHGQVHGVNTYWAVFLPYALGTPYTIFLMRQFFRGIPQEVVDAAKIDGCARLGVCGGSSSRFRGPSSSPPGSSPSCSAGTTSYGHW